MSMRISKSGLVFPLIGICLVTGCSRTSTNDGPAGDRIECAIGASAFANSCTIEEGAGVLTVHHPDGGFRRLVIDSNGAFSTADGADTATSIKRADGRTEVRIGQDRYVIDKPGTQARPR
jgi:hypothetical protein